MTIQAHRDFGQAGACAPAGPATVDKWRLLDALTDAAETFGIGHRQIGVLRALVGFHPLRHLPVTADHLVVYPSNRTLSARLGGMPDSTMRRHLSALVRAGLVARRSSSNGKRFRRGRGTDEIAFGLDLAPLVRHAAMIRTAARTAQDAAETLAAKRAELLALRHALRQQAPAQHATFLADLARALRRALSLDALMHLITELKTRLSAVTVSKKMSTSDSENERHIEQQDRKKKGQGAEQPETVTPAELDHLCHERRSFFVDPLQSWSDVAQAADVVAPMLGIDGDTRRRTEMRHGRLATAIAILYVLEQGGTVDNPGGYLRSLSDRPDMLAATVTALKSRQLSADNPQIISISTT